MKGMELIYNAVETYQAGEGVVEIIGVRNAFIRAMEAEAKIYVITEKVEIDGREEQIFVILNDGMGHDVFPLFTGMDELTPVLHALEQEKRYTVALMKLRDTLTLLTENWICDGVIINPASQNLNMPLEFYEDLLKRSLVSHVTLIHADITDLCTDAIVCSADQHISGKSGVDAAIQEKGGEAFRASLQGEELGLADVMGRKSAGALRSKCVFFTRCPVWAELPSHQALYDCYCHCMDAAQQTGCTSIAFPCIGAGRNGVPMETVIRLSTRAVTDWMAAHDEDYKIDVYFCCHTDEQRQMYQAYFDGVKG